MTRQFTSDSDLLRHLRRIAVPRGGSVAVLAGHFTLAFDPEVDRLVPLIRQEPLNTPLKELAVAEAGDFPVETFRLGARFLHACALSSSAQARLVLLVDDVSFTHPDLLPASAQLAPGRAGRLRRAYLAGADAVPATYVQILKAEGMLVRDALLPRDGVLLHSAHDLEARFRQAGTANIPVAAATRRCSAGAVARMLQEVSRSRITDLIFMVPDACAGIVSRSLELADSAEAQRPDIHLVQHIGDGSRPVTVMTRRGKAAGTRPDLVKTV